MNGSALLFALLAAGLGLWAIFKLALVGMFNYHLYRLADVSDSRRRQRLGGLFRMESVEVSPAALIEGLQTDIAVPYLPTQERQGIARALLGATGCSVVSTVLDAYSLLDLVVALGFPVLAVGTSGALVVIHVAFVEARLWRQDAQECESFYQMLSQSDSERFPSSF